MASGDARAHVFRISVIAVVCQPAPTSCIADNEHHPASCRVKKLCRGNGG